MAHPLPIPKRSPHSRAAAAVSAIDQLFQWSIGLLNEWHNRNIVSGWIPVVGAIGIVSRAASLVAAHGKPANSIRCQYIVGITRQAEAASWLSADYRKFEFGRLLEIRPTMIGSSEYGRL